LRQVHERRGALEIAVVNRHDSSGDDRHLVWRVKLLALSEDAIIVEQPMTLGQAIRVEAGIEMIAFLTVGQNRWMFHTTNIGPLQHPIGPNREVAAMRLTMPTTVERCQRRNYYRMETGELTLPEVDVWPLLDPKSVLVAERANELKYKAIHDPTAQVVEIASNDDEAIMPEVGPKFSATLLNIGGGGVGLRVKPCDAQSLTRHKVFWVRFVLPPLLDTPVCATGKLAHTNVDSTQHTYAGMAFDFSFNPGHQRVVVEQICRYITSQQQAQLDRTSAA
jgi:hypothetical protein